MEIVVPAGALVLLVGPSGSGKSTFARRHFRVSEILSSDAFRAMVADDEDDQAASRPAFEVLHLVAARRLARGRLSVVDATNLGRAARRTLLGMAAAFRRPALALVFDLPLELLLAYNGQRPGRVVRREVIEEQLRRLEATLPLLPREGYAAVHVLRSPAEVEAAVVRRA
ncbi:MAG TPA: AAA family ATPase [Candidatus Limnocylindrales bacterium]|nr:AAA family ATPase [Candidatus Limnocylindrales bacterium]